MGREPGVVTLEAHRDAVDRAGARFLATMMSASPGRSDSPWPSASGRLSSSTMSASCSCGWGGRGGVSPRPSGLPWHTVWTTPSTRAGVPVDRQVAASDLGDVVERVTRIELAPSAWESHKVGVLPKSDTGHVGHERPGLPLLVSGLWPADGPPTAALQSVIDRVSRCPRVSSDAGPPRSAIVDHRGDLLGAGWFAALSLPHTVPRRSWRAGSNRLRADRPATELLPATASSVSDLETS
jgi:hypothetical protein